MRYLTVIEIYFLTYGDIWLFELKKRLFFYPLFKKLFALSHIAPLQFTGSFSCQKCIKSDLQNLTDWTNLTFFTFSY